MSDIINLPRLRLLDEEETRYYIKLAQSGEESAVDKIANHNLRLVLKVSYRFKITDYDLEDLFQVGVIGLIKAIKGFDLNRGVKFSTYAVSKIIGEIKLHLRDDGIIHVSRKLKKIARVVKKKEEELQSQLNRSPTIGEIVKKTDYSREEIIEALEANHEPDSLYQSIYSKDGSSLNLIDRIEDDSGNKDIREMELMEVLKHLNERAKKIIYFRYFLDKTQQEIADEIGVSQVQVSRLEKKILKELKDKIDNIR